MSSEAARSCARRPNSHGDKLMPRRWTPAAVSFAPLALVGSEASGTDHSASGDGIRPRARPQLRNGGGARLSAEPPPGPGRSGPGPVLGQRIAAAMICEISLSEAIITSATIGAIIGTKAAAFIRAMKTLPSDVM